MLMQLTFVLLMAGTLVALLMYFRKGRDASSMPQPESGTLYVTGVSPRPDATGEQYVTLAGSISGPSLVAYEVYGRFAWDVNQWPSPGDQIPVVYPAGKPDHWQIGHPGARPYLGTRRQNPQKGTEPGGL
ncbi:hypothetical protein H0264_33490 [Nocardia huaxiensis]|uniref:Uncharacterized protein n=1 Tax=Nocardia huaxiensis TaxID=2755382 RepID=A0A7D6ZW17_9NOCA|nr:hypothetical protein H0264_33490 [Nocardia huaxiensis]